MAQLASASALGAEGPPFESEYPDKKGIGESQFLFYYIPNENGGAVGANVVSYRRCVSNCTERLASGAPPFESEYPDKKDKGIDSKSVPFFYFITYENGDI